VTPLKTCFNKIFWTQNYILLVQLILIVTALAKIKSICNPVGLHYVADQITGLQNKVLIIVVAATELLICGCLSVLKSIEDAIVLILGFSSIIAVYKFLKIVYGVEGSCVCFGSITQWWPWLDKHLETVSAIILLILFIPTAAMVISNVVNNINRLKCCRKIGK